MPALNPRSSVPLYAQLAEILLQQIRDGEFAEDASIPSENALASRYKIGRPTVRQATESLVRRGYLLRRRGAGTFVRPQSKHIDLFSLGGTLESFNEGGVELVTHLAEAPVLVDVQAESRTSDGVLPLTSKQAYRLVRVGQVEGEPVLLERFWLDAEVFPFFDKLKLAGKSLSAEVQAHYRLEATSADQRFSVAKLDADSATHLKLPKGTAVLRVERSLHFPTARNAIFVEMECLSERFSFTQHISTEQGGFSPQGGDE